MRIKRGLNDGASECWWQRFFNLQRIWSLKLNEHGRDIGKLVKKKTMLEPKFKLDKQICRCWKSEILKKYKSGNICGETLQVEIYFSRLTNSDKLKE